MSEPRFFELNDDVGLAHTHLTGPDGPDSEPVENPAAGSPEPLQRVSLTIGVPTMVAGEVLPVATAVQIEPAARIEEHTRCRVIPDTRVVEVADPLIANAMSGHPHFHEIDPPTKKAAAAKAATEAARAAGEEVN